MEDAEGLDNEAYWLEKTAGRIKIGGVGVIDDIQDIEPTISDVKEDDFVVLVSHNPDYAEEMETDLIDLVLAGHNHGPGYFPGLMGSYPSLEIWPEVPYRS